MEKSPNSITGDLLMRIKTCGILEKVITKPDLKRANRHLKK
jgi:hypothetical protein